MHVFRKQMWGSPMVSQVERRGDLIFDAFLCFCACFWRNLCAFDDVDTSPMMCETWKGVCGGMTMGRTICGSTPGMFCRVVHW